MVLRQGFLSASRCYFLCRPKELLAATLHQLQTRESSSTTQIRTFQVYQVLFKYGKKKFFDILCTKILFYVCYYYLYALIINNDEVLIIYQVLKVQCKKLEKDGI